MVCSSGLCFDDPLVSYNCLSISNNFYHPFTMKKIDNLRKKALLVIAVAFSSVLVVATDVRAEKSRNQNWYVAGSFVPILDAGGSGLHINLNPVVVESISDYKGNRAWSLAVGHEVALGTSHPLNVRIEVECVVGSIDRKSIDLPGTTIVLDDTVNFRALFLNGMLGLFETRHSRWWIGGGVGYGQTKFPDATSATPCGCLQPLTHDALSFRVKFQAEREISTNAALFAEAGYIKLTGGETNNIPGSDYGTLNVTNLALGLRVYL